jgi:hypothetical protein
MLKLKKYWGILIFAFLMIQFQPGTAKAQIWSDEIPTNVQICNTTNNKIIFWLRPRNGQWTQFDLASGGDQTFKRADEIYVKTDKWYVKYSLETGNRYTIFWNRSRSIYDVNQSN